MAVSKSAGVLIYRLKKSLPEVVLVHPGGPFWKNKDEGAWTIPKGEFTDEDPLVAAIRELKEETGLQLKGKYIPLTPVKQKSGKTVWAWAINANPSIDEIKSNEFEIEWPPKSGKKQSFPEIDKASWFPIEEAMKKIIPAQQAFLRELLTII